MWVLDYEADIESDLSAFHRIDDPMTVPAVRYFSLVLRLAAYTGALQARVAEERRERDGEQPTSHNPGGQQRQVISDSAALAMLGDETEWTKENA